MLTKERTIAGWFATAHHLGNHCPYVNERSDEIFVTFENAIQSIPSAKRCIDPTAILEIVNNNYILADRCIVRGLSRSPWMAEPAHGHDKWAYHSIPPHGSVVLSAEQIASRLKTLLKKEIVFYVQNSKNVGILLSGGLDSRVLAGAIRELQLSGQYNGDVLAVTWGQLNARDVRYAQIIAKRYNWQWSHVSLGPEELSRNIYLAATLGAECAPIHLHGLPDVAEIRQIDCILGASYGDSVGRAEFSSRHLLSLPPLLKHRNRLGLIRADVLRTAWSEVQRDIGRYRQRFARQHEYQYRELEQEIHYMRRMLLPPITFVAEKIRVHQIFTAPEVFGLMWSLSPACRNNEPYRYLLESLPGHLADIPWARTGVALGATMRPDAWSPQCHTYGRWLRHDLKGEILGLLNTPRLKELGVFNNNALKCVISAWSRMGAEHITVLDEKVSWLASLSVCLEKFNVQPISNPPNSWHDWARATRTRLECSAIRAKTLWRF